METSKQKLLLSYLISDQELFIKVGPILSSNYFDSELRSSIKFIKNYFDQYKAPPTPEQLKAETGTTIDIRSTLTRPELRYAEQELERFCRRKALEQAILAAATIVNAEDDTKFGDAERLVKDALTVSLERDIGLDYFQDPEGRLKLLSLTNKPIPTGLIKLDEYLGGGLNRKEMIIFAAPPGVGKSLTMANIARNLMSLSLNVVYITLELSEEIVAKRFDSMFSGIAQLDILKNITKTSIEIKKQADKYGHLTIKRMPESTTNANHIRAYLKEYEIAKGNIPDAVIVDYLDLMASNQSISPENMFIRDKFISEELRSIANEYNLVMITASQLNRSSQLLDTMEDLSQAHIAGGMSKVNTTDNLVAIMQSSAMKAKGEMLFKLLKTRSSNGVGNHFIVSFDQVSLIMSCHDEASESSQQLANFMRGRVQKKRDDQDGSSTVETKPKPTGPMGPKRLNVNNLPFQV